MALMISESPVESVSTERNTVSQKKDVGLDTPPISPNMPDFKKDFQDLVDRISRVKKPKYLVISNHQVVRTSEDGRTDLGSVDVWYEAMAAAHADDPLRVILLRPEDIAAAVMEFTHD